MLERRRVKRKYLLFYTRIFDARTDQLLGHLIDITPRGAMVISERPLPAGAAYRLRLELSPELSAEPFIEFDARSVWCQPDINPRFYNTGFQVAGLTPDQVAIVQHIVDAYGFRDN